MDVLGHKHGPFARLCDCHCLPPPSFAYLVVCRLPDALVVDGAAVLREELAVEPQDEPAHLLGHLRRRPLRALGQLGRVQRARRVARRQLVHRVGVVLTERERCSCEFFWAMVLLAFASHVATSKRDY